MLRVLIADDHPLFRDAIKEVIGQIFLSQGWEFTISEATRAEEVIAAAERDDELDLILLDLSMPGADGLSTLVSLRTRAPGTPVVVISSLDDPSTVRRAMACSAAGFISKSSPKDVIAAALQSILAGGVYQPRESLEDAGAPDAPGAEAEQALTTRQIAVLDLLTQGMSNKLIARALDISEMTVKAHVTAVLRKLGVSSRAQATATLRGRILT